MMTISLADDAITGLPKAIYYTRHLIKNDMIVATLSSV